MIFEILRGLPGSGKSHYAKTQQQKCPSAIIICADDYRINKETGKYEHKPEEDSAIHSMCFRRAVDLVVKEHNHIIIDNTNLRAIDIAPYHRLATAYNYWTIIRWFQTPFDVCLRHNQHGVDHTSMMKKAMNIDSLPPWYNVDFMPYIRRPDDQG